MDGNEAMGKVEELSVDGVLRQRSDGPESCTLGTPREGTGKKTRYRRPGNGSQYHTGADRAMEALDDCGTSSQTHGSSRGSSAELLRRTKVSILLGKIRSMMTMLLTGEAWDQFFHSRTDEAGCQWAGIIRIAYSIAALGNVIYLGLDYQHFFLPSSTFIPLKEGRLTIDQDTWSIFEFLPQTDPVYWVAYWLHLSHIILLLLGVAPRFQAVFVFFWTCMFRHHNNMIWDDEDTIFKQLAFYLIFFPLDRYTIWTLLKPDHLQPKDDGWPMWPFRLFQIQMCLVYMSTGLLKWKGSEWLDGSALFYVVHLDDLYPNLFNPHWLFGYYSVLKFVSWQTLVFEVTSPVLIWFDKTRFLALFTNIFFHLGLDLSMNLNFFHWIMSVGWLSFLVQPANARRGRSPQRKLS